MSPPEEVSPAITEINQLLTTLDSPATHEAIESLRVHVATLLQALAQSGVHYDPVVDLTAFKRNPQDPYLFARISSWLIDPEFMKRDDAVELLSEAIAHNPAEHPFPFVAPIYLNRESKTFRPGFTAAEHGTNFLRIASEKSGFGSHCTESFRVAARRMQFLSEMADLKEMLPTDLSHEHAIDWEQAKEHAVHLLGKTEEECDGVLCTTAWEFGSFPKHPGRGWQESSLLQIYERITPNPALYIENDDDLRRHLFCRHRIESDDPLPITMAEIQQRKSLPIEYPLLKYFIVLGENVISTGVIPHLQSCIPESLLGINYVHDAPHYKAEPDHECYVVPANDDTKHLFSATEIVQLLEGGFPVTGEYFSKHIEAYKSFVFSIISGA